MSVDLKQASQNLAQQVRDTLVLNEAVVIDCVNEVIASLPAHTAEVYRRLLKANASFGASLKRVTIDVGVVLSLAKSFESDEAFAESAGLMHDIEFAAHDGKVGAFAKAMVAVDLKTVDQAEAGELAADAVLYDMLPTDVVRRRLMLLMAFLDAATKRAA